jgi:hypothetical protein
MYKIGDYVKIIDIFQPDYIRNKICKVKDKTNHIYPLFKCDLCGSWFAEHELELATEHEVLLYLMNKAGG